MSDADRYIDTSDWCGQYTTSIVISFLAFYAILMVFLSLKYPEYFKIE